MRNLLPGLPAALSWCVSRQLPRHYTPGTSLKYANTKLSGRPFRFLGRPVPPHVCMRRNVYDHGEIKSTAKILPLIRMWSLLPPSLRRPRPSSLDPSKARARYRSRSPTELWHARLRLTMLAENECGRLVRPVGDTLPRRCVIQPPHLYFFSFPADARTRRRLLRSLVKLG